jgi:hypothetical protein
VTNTTDVKELTARLESGVKELFESDKYANYLRTMSRFHNYSSKNIQLIYSQKSDATLVAGYASWKNKFKRHVNKGEKGIKIFAPVPVVISDDKEKIDPETLKPVLDEQGMPVIEHRERTLARFKVVSVFDYAQTSGEPLPQLAENLLGNVDNYELFIETLRSVSTLPIVFADLGDMDGRCIYGDKIEINENLSEIQTISAIIHELVHSHLHDRSAISEDYSIPTDKQTREVQAESCSWVVCAHFGLETDANSFGYIADFSQGKELKELNASLDIIRKTSSEMINTIDSKFHELAKERGIDLTTATKKAAEIENEPQKDLQEPEPLPIDQIRAQLSSLSQLETLDEKYDLAFSVFVDALCNNTELLALANTGAEWQSGVGRAAIYNGGYYETLIDTFAAELTDILTDTSIANKLRNTVIGNVYRQLDAIAYDRYILDEYADICVTGRLETFETPYISDTGNNDRLVHLTEHLPDGSIYNYGEIFTYDPDDNRDHAINNYLSLKSFNELRESVFGKRETSVSLNFTETSPVGSTVLRPLLYTEGQFNREFKQTRVDVLPPMGKYSVYAQHLSGVIGDDTLIHVATDSGYLLSLGVSKARFDEQFIEAQIDRIFEKASQQLDAQLANPETFARYELAAITGRIAEVEAHNMPVRALQAEKNEARHTEAAIAEKEEQQQKLEKYNARIDEIATAIGENKTITVDHNESEFGGKNPVIDLFKLYGIDLPLRTQGWVKTGLVDISESGHRYYSGKHKGKSNTFSGCLAKLREAIKNTPIEQKRGRASTSDGKKETNTLENKLYEKFAELFPDILRKTTAI